MMKEKSRKSDMCAYARDLLCGFHLHFPYCYKSCQKYSKV